MLWVPEGNAEVVIANSAGATTSVSETDLVCAGFSASATVTVNVAVPVADGLPAITPVAGARLSPAGRAPDVMDQM